MTDPRNIDAGSSIIDGRRCCVWLCLAPVDTLFFRDGKPFDPASRAASGLPTPQVLAGALRTALLRSAGMDMAQLSNCIRKGVPFANAAGQVGGSLGEQIAQARVQGPYLGRRDGKDGRDTILYPAPVTLRRVHRDKDRIVRLDPLGGGLSLPGWKPQANGMVPLWTRDRNILKPLDQAWITQKGMSAFLSGGIPSPGHLVSCDDLYGFEDRTGIAVDPGPGTAQDGMIYATRRLVLKHGVRFWARVEGSAALLDLLPKQNAPGLLPFGGERRQVTVTACDNRDGPYVACAVPPRQPDHGRCLVLVTPGLLNGWRPPGLDLVSAAVPGHVPVSGWDLARGGPKPTRFAVRAGSVYFLPPGNDRPPGHGLGHADDTLIGWGEYCEGVWYP